MNPMIIIMSMLNKNLMTNFIISNLEMDPNLILNFYKFLYILFLSLFLFH